MEPKDKVIIVTGASQGIGLAAARLLGTLGAKVVLAARSTDVLKKLETEIKGSLAVVTDMRQTKDIENLVKKTMEKFGRIDILVNNAGQGLYAPLEKVNIEQYKQIMELNVFSVVEMMQAVVPIMKKQTSGVIINVSSMLAKMYIPRLSAYASTKYALNAISFTARQELEPFGITVSTVSPKMTATNFGKNSLGVGREANLQNNEQNNRPRPPIDTPEQVAEKIVEAIRTGAQDVTL